MSTEQKEKVDNYMKLTQKIDKIKSEVDETIKKYNQINMAVMMETQQSSQEYGLLKFMTGILFDNMNLPLIKEMDIKEEDFKNYYRPLIKTEKGDYYFNLESKSVSLVEGLINGWNVVSNENNIITWRNEEKDHTVQIEHIYDETLSPVENQEVVINKFKHKLRHPIELVV